MLLVKKRITQGKSPNHHLRALSQENIHRRDINIPLFIHRCDPPKHALRPLGRLITHTPGVLQENMIHKRLDISINSRNISFHRAKHTPIVTIRVFPLSHGRAHTLHRLLLDMAFREENPFKPDSGDGSMHVRVDDDFFFVLLGRVRDVECVALEMAVFALPDLVRVVHAVGTGLHAQPPFCIFADRPCAFAETPVVVFFARAAVHHFFLGGSWTLDGAGADGETVGGAY